MSGKNRQGIMTVRTVVTGGLLLLVIVSGAEVIRDSMDSIRMRGEQESLQQLASQSEPETATEDKTVQTAAFEKTKSFYVSPIDFDALKLKNPDTVGWLRIPDTNIDYPVVQASDNDKYLHTDFNGNESKYGAVYLDCDSDKNFLGWNHPIYGHHMKDETMFGDLVKFKDEEYFKKHQFFELYTPDRTIHLKAVACYYADSNGIVRKTKFKSRESFDQWVEERLKPCAFADMPVKAVDSMFVLVTCSYEMNDARTLLYAVEVEDGYVASP